MPYFLIGGVAYLFDWKKYANVQLSAALLLIFAGSLTVTTLYINEIICLIFLPYFVLSMMLSSEQKLVLKGIQGEYAYGMYLYGFLIQQCAVQMFFLGKEVTFINFHVSFIACVAVTYFFAMLSFKCVYIPENKINKWLLNKMK